jgi:CheY-like chemotaxis protein
VVDEALKGNLEKILVVEDDDDVRRITVRLLEGLNYDVVEANDGPAALKKLAELDEAEIKVDLVFSDLVMPFGMNGIDLSIAIWGKYPTTPVMLTSGYPEKVLREAGLGEEDLRQIKVIRKPYTRRSLSEAISGALAEGFTI